jgi:hypothetical protein
VSGRSSLRSGFGRGDDQVTQLAERGPPGVDRTLRVPEARVALGHAAISYS